MLLVLLSLLGTSSGFFMDKHPRKNRVTVPRKHQRSFAFGGQEVSATLYSSFPADSDRKGVPTIGSSSPTLPLLGKLKIWFRRHRQVLVISAVLASFLIANRNVWAPLMDRKRMQHIVLNILEGLNNDNSLANPKLIYSGGVAIWTALGLSPIPLETAAGMVFGWRGFLFSAMGKLVGSALAFSAGRHSRDWVQQKLDRSSDSEVASEKKPGLALLRYNRQTPLQTALLMKFSLFPDFIRDLGTAVLFPEVRLPEFLTATIAHAAPFSFVWTAVGVKAAAEMNGVVAGPKWVYRFCFLPVFLAVGAMPPVLMGWWVRALRKEQRRD